MQLDFERGSRDRPRGHALFYVRSSADPEAVFATYLIVLPVTMDIAKYIPPMLAGGLGGEKPGNVAVVAWPPIPEAVESRRFLEHLADQRDDDLIFGGSIDPTRLEAALQLAAEAGQEYLQAYEQQLRPLPAEQAGKIGEAPLELDVDEVLYSLMSERDRLAELVKLTGALRDAVEAGDRRRVADSLGDLRKLARHFPPKYRLDDFLAIADQPGEKGRRLVDLYIDRCYRVLNEDYDGLKQVDDQIKALS